MIFAQCILTLPFTKKISNITVEESDRNRTFTLPSGPHQSEDSLEEQHAEDSEEIGDTSVAAMQSSAGNRSVKVYYWQLCELATNYTYTMHCHFEVVDFGNDVNVLIKY